MGKVQLFVEHPRRAIIPFLGVALVAIGSLFLPPYSADRHDLLLAVAAMLVTSALACSVPFLPRTHWVVGAPPLLFFVVVAFLRNATGGESSGFLTLILLPIAWIVLYGTRWQLWLSAAATGLLFGVPAVLIGSPLYSGRSWRTGMIWLLFVVLVCPMLQRTVERLRTSEAAQRALAGELNAVLRAATEHAVIATDMAGLITMFSDGAQQMLGLARGETIGLLTWDQLIEPQEIADQATRFGLDAGPAVVTHAAAVADITSTHWSFVRRDGSRLRVRLTVTPLRGEHLEQVGWVGIGRDISAEEQARHELVTAERRWRTLLDHLPDLSVLVVGADLRYRVAIGAGLTRQGLNQVQGKSLHETSNADNAAILDKLYRGALAGQVETGELRSTGTGAVTEVIVTPLPPHDGMPEALVLARDVTQARADESGLRAARDRFARLFTESPHGTLLVDRGGRILQINPALCTLVENAAAALVGRHILTTALRELITPAELEGVLTGTSQRLSADRTLRPRTGRPVAVSVSFIALRGETDAVDSVLATVVDISERRRYEQQLARLAETDPLTGLANRRKFDAELAAHLERCQRYGAKGALLLMDLDNFKQTNDTLGHSAGDQLIISMAAALRTRLRSSDVIARLGGDEFAILLPEADEAATAAVANDIVQLTRNTVKLLDGSSSRPVTSSIGAVVIDDPNLTAGELLSTADMTMYDAKDAGRDRYILHDPKEFSRPRTRARIAWADRITHALETDGFTIHAQPILQLATGRIESAELLIRMNAEDGTLIPPGNFLYIAERTPLITDIDCLMLTKGVDILHAAQGIDPAFCVSVNLSGASIGHPRITNLISELTADGRIDPHGLILEITETAAISNIETARSFAETVRDIGCRFALDDFGAGYGSFYYLKHLLFDFVKIDGEFIAHCVENATDRLIISSIVDIAQGLGKQTIAEYVSDQHILQVITDLGLDYAQGFHIGRPEPLADLYATLQTTGTR